MSVRSWIFAFVALTSFVAVPYLPALDVTTPKTAASASDLDKYVPTKSDVYLHINMPRFFSSELVRKAIPMAFDKYSDQLLMVMGMAKQINPNVPELPEDQIKEGLKALTDPKIIGDAFDKAKMIVTDIVVAGSADDENPQPVILIKCEFIQPQMVEMIANLIAAQGQGQASIEKIKKSGGTIYAVASPQSEQKIYVTVPQNGLLHMAMSEEQAEASFAPAGKPSDKLASMMAKRDSGDFLFIAAVGDDDADFTSMAANLILDKNLTGQFSVDFKDADKAKEKADEANESLSQLVEQITMMLGDTAGDAAKAHLSKTKAEVDGAKVKARVAIPGSVFEELLKKDKE